MSAKVYQPGVYYDIPASEYFEIEAISSSLLKRLYVSSPRHVITGKEPTDAMELGTAFHSYVLDRDYHTKHFILPEKKLNWNSKEGREEKRQHEDFAASQIGKTPVTAYNMQCLEYAYNAMREHKLGSKLAGDITSGTAKTEIVLIWEEQIEIDGEEQAVLCKARLDILNGLIISDIKTTRNAHPLKFQWEVLPTKDGLNYWIQAGWYYRGAKANGIQVDSFDFIAIEMERPNGITWHTLEESELDSMQSRLTKLSTQWATCLSKQVFPNYPPVKHILSLGDDANE